MIPSHSFVCFAVKHFKHLPGLKLPYGEGMDQTIFPTDDSCRTMVSTDFDVPFEGRHFRIIYVRIMCITSILTVCSEVKIQHMFNAFVFIPNKLCIIFRVTLSFVRKKKHSKSFTFFRYVQTDYCASIVLTKLTQYQTETVSTLNIKTSTAWLLTLLT